jgi:hypothetical protein
MRRASARLYGVRPAPGGGASGRPPAARLAPPGDTRDPTMTRHGTPGTPCRHRPSPGGAARRPAAPARPDTGWPTADKIGLSPRVMPPCSRAGGDASRRPARP